jgi:antitoxin component of MazEF toxin-antitoxin module
MVRRTGNSLAVPIPRAMARQLNLAEGDLVWATFRRLPRLAELAGRLKGRITADEFTALSNEGEDLG